MVSCSGFGLPLHAQLVTKRRNSWACRGNPNPEQETPQRHTPLHAQLLRLFLTKLSPPVLLLTFISATWPGAGVEDVARCFFTRVALPIVVLQAGALQGYGGARLVGGARALVPSRFCPLHLWPLSDTELPYVLSSLFHCLCTLYSQKLLLYFVLNKETQQRE